MTRLRIADALAVQVIEKYENGGSTREIALILKIGKGSV